MRYRQNRNNGNGEIRNFTSQLCQSAVLKAAGHAVTIHRQRANQSQHRHHNPRCLAGRPKGAFLFCLERLLQLGMDSNSGFLHSRSASLRLGSSMQVNESTTEMMCGWKPRTDGLAGWKAGVHSPPPTPPPPPPPPSLLRPPSFCPSPPRWPSG